MGDAKKIVLVGHCGPDSYALKSAVSRMVAGSTVVLTGDERGLERELPDADLLLVNRVLDGDYTVESGIELIRRLAAAGTKAPLMLVSNFPEAQAEAIEAGARPGFGKRELYAEDTARKVRAAVEMQQASGNGQPPADGH